ncbi:MAG: radical SAM protein [Planctomycetota bacterium]
MISTPSFPIRLVFPPQGHFTQPYLALPCIQAWLEQHGFDDVRTIDASIEAYDHFLTPEHLVWSRGAVEDRLPLARFRERERLEFRELDAYRTAVESAVSAETVIAEIAEAKRTLRSEAAFDRDLYVPAVRTIYHGLRLASAAHFPSRLTPHNFTMRYANDRSAEVLAATEDGIENPFVDYFERHLLPRLVAERPRIVALSVIYGSQLIPALTLGRMVKRALPDCHVTAGGGFLAYIGKKLMHAPGVDACLDSMIFFEGEAPMLKLAETLRAGGDLAGVGSTIWFDRTNGRVETIENPAMHPIRLDDAPLPTFDDLPFELYFSPETVLPFDINRGCYYGECSFCTLPTVIGPGYRTRRADTIADMVVDVRDRFGVRHFNFITDCMPPGMIRDLPDELIARDAGVYWWSDARVEPKAYTLEGAQRLFESGCRKLLFGFETATPRLLKMMKKGQSVRSTLEVARNCTDAGISVTFYAMVGFPTETREEARATLAFLVENNDVVREVSLQTFHIDEVAETYSDPAQFGITILDDPAADLELYHDYLSESGMTQEEAAEMFAEMMAGFAEHLPLFSGDNIFYFMQKSHYFLHLARGTTPDEFGRESRRRATRRANGDADPELALPAHWSALDLPFSYTEVVAKLAHPLAQAIRPDFLTGRFVEGAEQRAEAVLGGVERKPRALVYGRGAEFLELRSDGVRALEALDPPGSLGALLPRAADGHAALDHFATRLHRFGLLERRVERTVSV